MKNADKAQKLDYLQQFFWIFQSQSIAQRSKMMNLREYTFCCIYIPVLALKVKTQIDVSHIIIWVNNDLKFGTRIIEKYRDEFGTHLFFPRF